MRAQESQIDLICGQNDVMAMGAKKAVKELANELDRDRLSSIPATGCDGVPNTGQAWVRTGQLSATVIVPPSVMSLKFVPHFWKRKPRFINGFEALIYTSYLRDRTLVAARPLHS
jgi:ABC-type sugar transport system substrate-binding protein